MSTSNKRTSGSQGYGSSYTNPYTPWAYLREDELEVQLNKFKTVYTDVINKLIRYDKQKIFRFPVDTTIVTDYLTYVKHPMDFETMLNKNEERAYQDDIKVFDNDVSLIVGNCKIYNAPETIFYEAALKLEEVYTKLRPSLLKKITDISNGIRKRCLGASSKSAVRQKSYPNIPLPTEVKLPPQPLIEPLKPKHIIKPEPAPNPSESVDNSETQSIEGELHDVVAAVAAARRKKKKNDMTKVKPLVLKQDKSNPISNAIQIALSVSGLNNETFGKLMSNFNGFHKLLNTLDIAQHHLSMNPHSKTKWFNQSMKPLRRIITHFEWKKTFDFPTSAGRNSMFRKIQILMSRLKKDTYKKSVEDFIGQENLEKVNEVYPNLSNTLSELCIPYQILSNTTELRF
ncbi:bromodomain containing protein [Theileria equi strain WA]|uniref:Bromodomain containing protein n=1 Tax=Theileria equi strain WA TaxID=1537102 RepID=L0AUG2_THEEQ|nr:bromodomain containing protein [Theileria equi strain WA]AFZ79195.1 bromodomain containing protein [Theileria equi strain WA]|eukprot:XP_004828861.1 bromodomain containing protein [Theileria equi strain WA]